MPNRIQKVNELLRQNISEFLSHALTVKQGVFITLTKVDTSKDLRYAKVFFSVYPENDRDYIIKVLTERRHVIQSYLFKKLSLKPFPSLTFVSDATEDNADHIEKLLRSLKEGATD